MKILFELEENELGITPMKTAEALINAGVEVEASSFQKAFGLEKVHANIFDCNDLMEIADYLKVYCKYNMEENVKNE